MIIYTRKEDHHPRVSSSSSNHISTCQRRLAHHSAWYPFPLRHVIYQAVRRSPLGCARARYGCESIVGFFWCAASKVAEPFSFQGEAGRPVTHAQPVITSHLGYKKLTPRLAL